MPIIIHFGNFITVFKSKLITCKEELTCDIVRAGFCNTRYFKKPISESCCHSVFCIQIPKVVLFTMCFPIHSIIMDVSQHFLKSVLKINPVM